MVAHRWFDDEQDLSPFLKALTRTCGRRKATREGWCAVRTSRQSLFRSTSTQKPRRVIGLFSEQALQHRRLAEERRCALGLLFLYRSTRALPVSP